MSIAFYNGHAVTLSAQYLSKTFEEVHSSWLHHLLPILARDKLSILDVGAGSGRDVHYLAKKAQSKETQIFAIEPAIALAKMGLVLTRDLPVRWIEDSLPQLQKVVGLAQQFDLILLSAVWMHLSPSERPLALATLSRLLNSTGLLVISLRHGLSPDARVMHQVSADELLALAADCQLALKDSSQDETDKLGRTQVHWQTLVFTPKAVPNVTVPEANAIIQGRHHAD
ncbi:class I SAM-dependent methyltransferase [Shewanella baltica]|uniref:class I SAM-dependent methyltransferase n=1 Tax=Shewanella baltica TaxID=62322 RepID=UPI00217ED3AE|nr:class I SAM-dependent methyltransferase [Shewanella baltica]MCS6097368.1 class I SAM-dependent methyltransferase [Shewanella baltica]MCS6228462.1 class I SAM-dependent methyltransferase [Shewanella baltica]